MSYYSRVALCVSAKVVIPEDLQIIMESMGLKEVSTHQGSRLYLCDRVQWKSDFYPEICYLDRFMQSMFIEDYKFIRIGDYSEDTEFRGDFYTNPFGLGMECQFIYSVRQDPLLHEGE